MSTWKWTDVGGDTGVLLLWNGTYVEFKGKGFQPVDQDAVFTKHTLLPYMAKEYAGLRAKYTEHRPLERVDVCLVLVVEKLEQFQDGEELKAGVAW